MVSVKAQLVSDIKQNQQAAGHADSKSENIEQGIALVL